MRQLYHLPIEPSCRFLRILLAEKGLDFELRAEKVWDRRESFLRLNPAGEVPVLIDSDGTTLSGVRVIAEYLEEVYPEPDLLGATPIDRAETRRLFDWFDLKFQREVTRNLVHEKILNRFLGLSEPNGAAIRAGLKNLKHHLAYVAWLGERRRWLAGEHFTLADVALTPYVNRLDMLGLAELWQGTRPALAGWFDRIRARPSFEPALYQYIPPAMVDEMKANGSACWPRLKEILAAA